MPADRGYLRLPEAPPGAPSAGAVAAPGFDVWPEQAGVAHAAAPGGARFVEIARATASFELEPLSRAALAGLGAPVDPPGCVRLCPGVRVIPVVTPTLPPATRTNVWVVGEESLVVLDPASPHVGEQRRLAETLEALGRPVERVVLTHHHRDHVAGARALADRFGVPVAAHAVTAALTADAGVTETLVEADRVGRGQHALTAIFTPGHAPGHLCFHHGASGAVVAGDMVAGTGTILVDPDEGSMTAYLASLERLRAFTPAALLPAHGPPILDADAKLVEYREHRLMRERRVVDALAGTGPATPRELVSYVYADVSPALYGLAERSLLAHLIKLVEDGRATVQDGRYRIS